MSRNAPCQTLLPVLQPKGEMDRIPEVLGGIEMAPRLGDGFQPQSPPVSVSSRPVTNLSTWSSTAA